MNVLGETNKQIHLKQVWHVPKLGKSLLSVSQVDKAGYLTTFGNGKVKITNKVGNVFLVGSLNSSGLYEVNLENRPKVARLTELWHMRLGHAGAKCLKDMGLRQDGQPIDCIGCQLGKAHRLPFQRKLVKAPVGEVVHVDLNGPMETNGLFGEKYFMAVTDEGSDFTMVKTLNHKAAGPVEEGIREFVNYLEN